jgi:hypothetical protein
MIFNENDIDYKLLDENIFEELCFDLIIKMNYKNVIWKQGSADNGRDIEAMYEVHNPLVEYSEKWFFECKYYTNGVPPEKLNSKIAWADAEGIDHLVFIVSSHITNNGYVWLDKMREKSSYQIHVIDGAKLKKILVNYTDIISKYFLNSYRKILKEMKNNWVIHNLFPSAKQVLYVLDNIDISELKTNDLGFVVFMFCKLNREFEELFDDECIEFDFKPYIVRLLTFANHSDTPLIKNTKCYFSETSISFRSEHDILNLTYIGLGTIDDEPIMYFSGITNDNIGIEFIISQNSDTTIQLCKYDGMDYFDYTSRYRFLPEPSSNTTVSDIPVLDD